MITAQQTPIPQGICPSSCPPSLVHGSTGTCHVTRRVPARYWGQTGNQFSGSSGILRPCMITTVPLGGFPPGNCDRFLVIPNSLLRQTIVHYITLLLYSYRESIAVTGGLQTLWRYPEPTGNRMRCPLRVVALPGDRSCLPVG